MDTIIITIFDSIMKLLLTQLLLTLVYFLSRFTMLCLKPRVCSSLALVYVLSYSLFSPPNGPIIMTNIFLLLLYHLSIEEMDTIVECINGIVSEWMLSFVEQLNSIKTFSHLCFFFLLLLILYTVYPMRYTYTHIYIYIYIYPYIHDCNDVLRILLPIIPLTRF